MMYRFQKARGYYHVTHHRYTRTVPPVYELMAKGTYIARETTTPFGTLAALYKLVDFHRPRFVPTLRKGV